MNVDAKKPTPDINLRGIEGACAGEVFPLSPEAETYLGRQKRGIHIADPQVSLEHAVIRWDEFRGYQVVDLGSVRGTMVDGRRVGEKPVPLPVDARLFIGDAVFVVESRDRNRTRMIERLAFGLFMASALVLGLFMLMPRGSAASRVLVWNAPVRQGAVVSRNVRLDDVYLRSRGIRTKDIKVNRVSDANGDEVDELWLSVGERVFVVTFGEDGRWIPLGTLPKGCAVKTGQESGQYPDFDCGAVEYSFYNGRFRPVEQSGVVVWGVPAGAWDAPGNAPAEKVVARRMPLRHPQGLAGFLASSGIGNGVHYILCEDAMPGLQAQALLFDGTHRGLGAGCRDAVEVSGFKFSEIRGVALTAHGYDALLDDLRIHLGGSRTDLFVPDQWKEVVAAWTSSPAGIQAQTWVEFQGVPHFFNPIAAEGDVPVPRTLIWEGSVEPAVKASVATIASSGTAVLDLPGCAKLKVETSTWICDVSKGCLSSSAFMQASEVGCGVVRDVGSIAYEDERITLDVDGLDVVMLIEADEVPSGLEVSHARVAWRAKQAD